MPGEVVLAVSLELAGASWKIALHDGKRDKPAIYTVSEQAPVPRLLHAVAVIEAVRQRWSLPQQALSRWFMRLGRMVSGSVAPCRHAAIE
jgi:hypothetical protein